MVGPARRVTGTKTWSLVKEESSGEGLSEDRRDSEGESTPPSPPGCDLGVSVPQVNGQNVVKVGHRQVVNMIRQGGNTLMVKVVMVTRHPDMDEAVHKKGDPLPFGQARHATATRLRPLGVSPHTPHCWPSLPQSCLSGDPSGEKLRQGESIVLMAAVF